MGGSLIDMDLGIGTDHLDLEQRTQNSTLKKNVMKRKMDLDNLGEELRVLLCGHDQSERKTDHDRNRPLPGQKLGQMEESEQSGPIPYTVLTTAGSYLDWVLMTAPDDPELLM